MSGISRGLGPVTHLDPPGSTYITTVNHPAPGDPAGGRLLRLRNGKYAILLAGTMRSVDQRWARRVHERQED